MTHPFTDVHVITKWWSNLILSPTSIPKWTHEHIQIQVFSNFLLLTKFNSDLRSCHLTTEREVYVTFVLLFITQLPACLVCVGTNNFVYLIYFNSQIYGKFTLWSNVPVVIPRLFKLEFCVID